MEIVLCKWCSLQALEGQVHFFFILWLCPLWVQVKSVQCPKSSPFILKSILRWCQWPLFNMMYVQVIKMKHYRRGISPNLVFYFERRWSVEQRSQKQMRGSPRANKSSSARWPAHPLQVVSLRSQPASQTDGPVWAARDSDVDALSLTVSVPIDGVAGWVMRTGLGCPVTC